MLTGHPSTTGDTYQLNVTTMLRHAARTYPETEVVYRDSEGRICRSNYATEWTRVNQMARALESLGVEAGDVVGVLDWNSRRHMELYFAIPGLAATHLQLNAKLSREDLGYVVRHSGARWIVVDESLMPIVESLDDVESIQGWIIVSDRGGARPATHLPNPVYLEDEIARQPETEYDWQVVDERTAAYAGYTTGTTGRPKGIFYSHRSVYLHAWALHTSLSFNHRDCLMPVTPMFHVMSWGFVHSAVLAGAKLVMPGQYSAGKVKDLAEFLVNEGVTISNGAPAIWTPLLEYFRSEEPQADLTGLRVVVAGSEPALSLMKGFRDVANVDIVHGYGASETSPIVSINWNLKSSLNHLTEDEKWDLKRSQGLPSAGVDIKVVSVDGQEQPHDGQSAGEIYYKGPFITQEYFDRPETADAFDDGWWRSGDVGVIDENGYLKLTDRLKDVIKSGGEWISSIDMENAILDNPRIAEAAVIGVPDEKWDERPVAYVVAREGEAIDDEAVLSTLRARFAKWQLPERIVVMDQLPRTSVGKLNKKKLRTDHAG
ncbi:MULTISPECIES: long-chain-fatty-acid--CoA ligase [Kocuria]|uniref:long-chain-fatty-acid--CoA ligase n=1 Tax=Kocuria TaxID=57493 RepID=UPI000A1C9E29|nr:MULTISPECIES: long-chain-fatty-acid--CoA ligase [Kocuria]RUQ22684.1 fatty-acid--CoA ligase [Kocuria sp. HSID16901]